MQSGDSGANSPLIYTTGPSGGRANALLKFDFSSLPAGVTITAAVLSLNYNGTGSGANPVGRNARVSELTQLSWLNTATWTQFQTGYNWVTPGGDFTDVNAADATFPASYGWMTWNVMNLCKHAQANHSEVAHFHIRDNVDSATLYGGLWETPTAKLEITYSTISVRSNILIF